VQLPQGTTVRTTLKSGIEVVSFLSSGGQGFVYKARYLDTGELGILKIFKDEYVNADSAKRAEFLVVQQLHKKHICFAAPSEVIIQKPRIGHFSRLAKGVKADDFLYDENETYPYIQSVELALAIVGALEYLHSLGIIHGDIHPGNLYISRVGSVLYVEIIDFDNFRAKGLPLPSAVGHILYLAPELRKALAACKPAVPDEYTERYAVTVLMHEILLSKHPASGYDRTSAEMNHAMSLGVWLHDPFISSKVDVPNGLPSFILDYELASLFRRGLGKDPEARPSASEWRAVLQKALDRIFICPLCGSPCFVDVSKKSCPVCLKNYPNLNLVTSSGKVICLDNGCIRIGRTELEGARTVSALHAVFRQVGPFVYVENVGVNGTYKREKNGIWTHVKDREPLLVETGDVLRLADVEVKIE